jgi:hypothetical protein
MTVHTPNTEDLQRLQRDRAKRAVTEAFELVTTPVGQFVMNAAGKSYKIHLDARTCTCPDFETRCSVTQPPLLCKHLCFALNQDTAAAEKTARAAAARQFVAIFGSQEERDALR